MSDILIQFHGLREELLPFVKRAASDFGLHVVAMRFFPFQAVVVDAHNLDDVMSECSPYDRIAFVRGVLSPSVTSGNDFLDRNPQSLILDLGTRTETGLKESLLSARTSDPETASVWKEIVKRLKAMTVAGAYAVDPATGAAVKARTHRYTAGAKNLELSGIQMLPIAGTTILKLGKQPVDES
jgi:hypothetical protein